MTVKLNFGPKNDQEVWVGLVEHKHGKNFYAGKTEASLVKQIADYCREWWHDWPSLNDNEPPEYDEACILGYFEGIDWEETYEIDGVSIK